MSSAISNHPEHKMTLYAFSLISASVRFWKQPEVLEEIRLFPNKRAWHEVTQKVLDLVDSSDELLKKMIPDLKDQIVKTGTKTYVWIFSLRSEHGLEMSCVNQIYWSPMGYVDEIKTLNSLWENYVLILETRKKFRLACIFAQEEFIQRHQNEMIDELIELLIEDNLKIIDLEMYNYYCDETYRIISGYLCHYFNENFTKMFTKINQVEARHKILCDQNISSLKFELYEMHNEEIDLLKTLIKIVKDGSVGSPDVMVKLCVIYGLVLAIEYYYKKLNNFEIGTLSTWISRYCRLNLLVAGDDHYKTGKLKEIQTLIDSSDC